MNIASNPLHLIKQDLLLLIFLCVSVSYWFYGSVYFLLALPVAVIILLKPSLKQAKKVALWLLAFSFVYLLCCLAKGLISARSQLLYYLNIPVFWLVGCYLARRYKYDDTVLSVILFIVLVFYASPFLYIILGYSSKVQAVVLENRMVLDEFGNQVGGSTLFGLYLSTTIAGLGLVAIPGEDKRSKWMRWIGFAIGVASLYAMAQTVTRSSIGLAVIILVFSFYMLIRRKGKRRNALWFLFSAVIVLSVLYYFWSNTAISQFAEAYSVRNEYGGANDFGGRSHRWRQSLYLIMTHPFGTSDGRGTVYGWNWAHNLWLDIGLTAGWIPFLIFLVITVKAVLNYNILRKDINYSFFTRSYLGFAFVAFFVSSFVEPALDGSHYHVPLFLMVCGMINELVTTPINNIQSANNN